MPAPPTDSSPDPQMLSRDVVELVMLFEAHGIEVWVDGGWGVDTLVGAQTRPHGDLDIAVRHSDVPKLRAFLAAGGYNDVTRDDTRECNIVLGDGREVDVHSFTFDGEGNLTFGVAGCRRPPRRRSPVPAVRHRATGRSGRGSAVQACARRGGSAGTHPA